MYGFGKVWKCLKGLHWPVMCILLNLEMKSTEAVHVAIGKEEHWWLIISSTSVLKNKSKLLLMYCGENIRTENKLQL